MSARPLPQSFGRYQVRAALGAGGMAQVYRGYDPVLDREVAIKVVGSDLRADPAFSERFRREARTIAGLHHPKIVQVYDFGEDAGGHYMVMEYVPGRSLAEHLAGLRAAGKRMPPDEIVVLLEQVAAALDYAHAHGVIHRDVKPGNVLLRGGSVRDAVLADFGLVMLLNRTSQMTQGQSFGTPEYIAPEQALQSSAASPQSDIYALGVLAYAMFTGALPFSSTSPIDLALKHVSEPPPPLRTHAPELSPQIEAAVLKALEKDPKRRYATAGEFVASLTPHPQPRAQPPRSEAEGALPSPERGEGARGSGVRPDAPTRAPEPLAKTVPGTPANPFAPWLSPLDLTRLFVPSRPLWRLVLAFGALAVVVILLNLLGWSMASILFPAAPASPSPAVASPGPQRTAPPGSPAASVVPATATPTPTPTATVTATPADPLALIQALKDEVQQAQDAKQITGKIGKDLRGYLDKAANALKDGDTGKARDQLNSFLDYLDKQSGKIPADLVTRWQAEVAAIQALIGPQGLDRAAIR
jgi:serine/threonine protein kinase